MPVDINDLLNELDRPKAIALIEILARKFKVNYNDVCLYKEKWQVDTRVWIDNNYWEKE